MSHAVDLLRILVVEDDEDSADLLAETFQDRGHQVEICRNGASALAAVTRFLPHVAVLDVGLPDMTGYALATQIRAIFGASSGNGSDASAQLHLIALTGYGGEEERARALAAGFDAHLLKPAHPDVLVRAVEQGRRPNIIAELAKTKDSRAQEALAGEKLT